MKVYFDESGNTGQNLLDDSQPVYVLASNNYTDDELDDVLKPITANGVELHFKKIKKYNRYQKQLIEVLNHELIDFKNIKYSYANKKYVLVCHIVDQLIEPVFYDFGLDLYKNGKNISFSNAIYVLGVFIWDKMLFHKFLYNFQNLIREPSDENIENFYDSVFNLYKTVSEQERLLLEPIIHSKKQIKSILNNLTKYTIDLSLATFAVLCDWWGKQNKENYDVIHDDSKQIEFWKDYINFVNAATKDNPKEVGYDYRKMSFPLAINSLSLENSKILKQIQFSDIISSSINYCIKKKFIEEDSHDSFANEIFGSKISNIKSHPIMPSAKVTPEELGTVDDIGVNPLDYLADISKKYKADFDMIMNKLKNN